MARDYKNARRPPRRKKRRSGFPPWAWLLAGLTLGGALAVIAFLLVPGAAPHHPASSRPASHPSPRASAGTTGKTAASGHTTPRKQTKAAKPRFNFYKLLPNFKIVIPRREHEAEPQPSQGGKVVKPGRYYLQAGAFRHYSDADQLKAKLALLGIEASIQKVTIDSQGEGKDTWHRVRIGPFTDLSRLNTTRARLRKHGIQALVIRLQDGG
ncbi:MAG TPA: SPOR domain-containing protein [Gammaproteobacteria bacterium]|nr:SPOR domain-containing protein [Gammaproteobacteria bacterium]